MTGHRDAGTVVSRTAMIVPVDRLARAILQGLAVRRLRDIVGMGRRRDR